MKLEINFISKLGRNQVQGREDNKRKAMPVMRNSSVNSTIIFPPRKQSFWIPITPLGAALQLSLLRSTCTALQLGGHIEFTHKLHIYSPPQYSIAYRSSYEPMYSLQM
jgi:hypothetical protein